MEERVLGKRRGCPSPVPAFGHGSPDVDRPTAARAGGGAPALLIFLAMGTLSGCAALDSLVLKVLTVAQSAAAILGVVGAIMVLSGGLAMLAGLAGDEVVGRLGPFDIVRVDKTGPLIAISLVVVGGSSMWVSFKLDDWLEARVSARSVRSDERADHSARSELQVSSPPPGSAELAPEPPVASGENKPSVVVGAAASPSADGVVRRVTTSDPAAPSGESTQPPSFHHPSGEQDTETVAGTGTPPVLPSKSPVAVIKPRPLISLSSIDGAPGLVHFNALLHKSTVYKCGWKRGELVLVTIGGVPLEEIVPEGEKSGLRVSKVDLSGDGVSDGRFAVIDTRLHDDVYLIWPDNEEVEFRRLVGSGSSGVSKTEGAERPSWRVADRGKRGCRLDLNARDRVVSSTAEGEASRLYDRVWTIFR